MHFTEYIIRSPLHNTCNGFKQNLYSLLQIRVFVLLLLIRYVNDNKNVTVNQIDQIKKVKIFLQPLILVFVNVSISGREPI